MYYGISVRHAYPNMKITGKKIVYTHKYEPGPLPFQSICIPRFRSPRLYASTPSPPFHLWTLSGNLVNRSLHCGRRAAQSRNHQDIRLTGGILREARVEPNHVTSLGKRLRRHKQPGSRHMPVNTLRARRGSQRARVDLESIGLEDVNDLGHDERRGLDAGAGGSDLVDDTEDGLKQGSRGTGGSTSVLAAHDARALGGSGRGLIGDVNVHTDDGNLLLGGLEDHVHLHGLGGAVVEVLGGQVEVELLKLEGLSVGGEGAALGNDLDSRAKILELGTIGHVVDGQLDVRALEDLEDAVNHVDGGLAGAGCASGVGGV